MHLPDALLLKFDGERPELAPRKDHSLAHLESQEKETQSFLGHSKATRFLITDGESPGNRWFVQFGKIRLKVNPSVTGVFETIEPLFCVFCSVGCKDAQTPQSQEDCPEISHRSPNIYIYIYMEQDV